MKAHKILYQFQENKKSDTGPPYPLTVKNIIHIYGFVECEFEVANKFRMGLFVANVLKSGCYILPAIIINL